MADEIKLKIKLEGEIHEITCDEDETILEAALREGIDAPYGCMAGTCNACQATLTTGDVEMEYCDALTDEEVKSGEILVCQAKPAMKDGENQLEVVFP